MVERIEDLNLPNSVVTRIIKEALPENTSVTKETRIAVARAASVFIIFLTSSATSLAQKQNHKTISIANVLESLRELDFKNFIKPLEKDLQAFRKTVVDKKKETKARKNAAAKENVSNSLNTSDVVDITEDDIPTTDN